MSESEMVCARCTKCGRGFLVPPPDMIDHYGDSRWRVPIGFYRMAGAESMSLLEAWPDCQGQVVTAALSSGRREEKGSSGDNHA